MAAALVTARADNDFQDMREARGETMSWGALGRFPSGEDPPPAVKKSHFNVQELTDLLRRDFGPRAIEAIAAAARARDVSRDSCLSRDEFSGFLEDLYLLTGLPQPPDDVVRQQVVRCFREYDPQRSRRLGHEGLCAFLRASEFREALGTRWRPRAPAAPAPPAGARLVRNRSPPRSPPGAPPGSLASDEKVLLQALRDPATFPPDGCEVPVARGVVRAFRTAASSGAARAELGHAALTQFFAALRSLLALPAAGSEDAACAEAVLGGAETATRDAVLKVLRSQWLPLLTDSAGRRKRIREQYDYSVDGQGNVHSPEERGRALLEWRRGMAHGFMDPPADAEQADRDSEEAFTLHAWMAGLAIEAAAARFLLEAAPVGPGTGGDTEGEQAQWAVQPAPDDSAPVLRDLEGDFSPGCTIELEVPERDGYAHLPVAHPSAPGWVRLAHPALPLRWQRVGDLPEPAGRQRRRDLRSMLWRTAIAIVGRRQDAVLLPIRELGLQLVRDEAKADLLWTREDLGIQRARSAPRHQLLTSFPGMREFARKIPFARHLQRMSRFFPGQFDFVPRTWNMPQDFGSLKEAIQRGTAPRTFIVKPSAGSEGKGIYLAQDLSKLDASAADVVQEYVEPPMLWGGLKFDLRIYVLVTSLRPLRAFIHEDGLARLATEEYRSAAPDNLGDFYMHLTNYSLNKDSPKFEENTDAEQDSVGHKRSLRAFWEWLRSEGRPVGEIRHSIRELILNTLAALSPGLAVLRDAVVSPEDRDWLLKCVHLIGFDVMLDDHNKPWIIEINSRPSLGTDAPIDLAIKTRVVSSMLAMACHDSVDRQRGADGLWNRAAALVDEERKHPGGRGGRQVPRAGVADVAQALRCSRDDFERRWHTGGQPDGDDGAQRGWVALYPSADFLEDAVAPLQVFGDELQSAFERACGVRCRYAMSSARFIIFARAAGLISDGKWEHGLFSRAEAEQAFRQQLREADDITTSGGVGVLGFFEWCDFVLDRVTPRLYEDLDDFERWQRFTSVNIARVSPDD
eukprot:TRINITY_DN6297_c0_g1_i2.p1 TRINITY_DN6297_c0_g1~~TRINITY_DN6297_c0_g1_i2.p1  ORF type:complete len:1025 (+),score=279.33 TRINITY_DN6297_c0_g1_i2:72-3146(+)